MAYELSRRKFLRDTIGIGAGLAAGGIGALVTSPTTAYAQANVIESFKSTLLNYAEFLFKAKGDGTYSFHVETVYKGEGLGVYPTVEIKNGVARLKQDKSLVLIVSNRPQSPLKWSERPEFFKNTKYNGVVDTYRKGDRGLELYVDKLPDSERNYVQQRFDERISALEEHVKQDMKRRIIPANGTQ